jgi:hypothetical protein
MPGVKLINPVTPPRMKEITWWGSPSNQYHWITTLPKAKGDKAIDVLSTQGNQD